MVAVLTATVRPAIADQQYDVRGQDVYRVGSAGIVSRVDYVGEQRLTVERIGGRTRYDAQARYTRSAPDGSSHADARFIQELLTDGSFDDKLDNDPDFLTILNQPFAVQLDAPTIHDLRNLHGPVPFSATSPLGGQAVLRGYLRPATGGTVDTRQAVAVRFEAAGAMSAPMPSHTEATMTGQMRMDGTAYYSMDDAVLLALDATLTIVAQLRDGNETVPVRIVYRRYIRASGRPGSVPLRQSPAKMPRPTPLATGGGTGFRPTR
jgi:hypothetical protein